MSLGTSLLVSTVGCWYLMGEFLPAEQHMAEDLSEAILHIRLFDSCVVNAMPRISKFGENPTPTPKF